MTSVFYSVEEDEPYLEYSRDKPINARNIIQRYLPNSECTRLMYVIYFPVLNILQLGIVQPDGYADGKNIKGHNVMEVEYPNITSRDFQDILLELGN